MEEENAIKMAHGLGVAPEELLGLADEPGVVAELAVQLAALELRVTALENDG